MELEAAKTELEASRRTIRFFEALLHSYVDGILITDSCDKIIVVNETFSRWFETSPGAMVGKNFALCLEQADSMAPQAWREFEKHTRKNGRCDGWEFSFGENGCIQYFNVFGSVVQGGRDQEKSVVASVWRDVTKRRQSQEKLIRNNEKLDRFIEERALELIEKNNQLEEEIAQRKRAEKEKLALEKQLRQAHKMEAIGTLAGGIAHDFNNILSPIIGYTEMTLQDLGDNPLLRNNLEQVLSAANRAKGLVTQILTFSRQSEDQLQPLYLHIIMDNVLSLIRASLPSTIEIKRRIRRKCPPVMGDGMRLHQAAMNLCTNAYQAMRETGGVLGVTLGPCNISKGDIQAGSQIQPGKYARITVSDTGGGIAPEIMERIFEPYFTTKPVGEGTGMGLAMVHAIVLQHGGDIRVKSEPEKGAVFEVFLPATDESPLPEKEESEGTFYGTERIMIVEDEEPLLEMICQMFRRLGYKVTGHSNGLKAFKDFSGNPEKYDLVITDMTMPGLTGDALAVKMLSIKPDLPVVMCTGYSERMNEKIAEDLGIPAFVSKPLRMKEIVPVVREQLDRRKKSKS